MSFFAYALKYNLRLVVVSKLGNIDRSYNYKVKLPFGLELKAEGLSTGSGPRGYYPILKRHSKAPC